MKRIKFDIRYRNDIESGKVRLVTESGLPVEIVKWDVQDYSWSILGIVSVPGEFRMFPVEYTMNGLADNSDYDLFIEADDSYVAGYPTEEEIVSFIREVVKNGMKNHRHSMYDYALEYISGIEKNSNGSNKNEHTDEHDG